MSGYAYIPYVTGTPSGVYPEGWLRIGFNSAGRDAWVCTSTNTVVKCAYVFDGYYYVLYAAAMINANGLQRRLISGSYNEQISWSLTVHSNPANPDMRFEELSGTQAVASMINSEIPIYNSSGEAYVAFNDGNWDFPSDTYPITYRPTNCSFPNAPTEAAVGDTVTVPVAFTEGYTLVNSSDIHVTCNGVLVPSTYDNGTLTFTMPDPS